LEERRVKPRLKKSGVEPPQYQGGEMADWPHAPVHRMPHAGAYMVTAGTCGKEQYFNTPERLNMAQKLLFDIADEYDWKLQAWAIMSNHYHFMALSPTDAGSLKKMISKLHTLSAREINRLDNSSGRKVWFQYWDSLITFEKSYFARLNYVHQNPVHHGLVKVADQYEWCSAKWFMLNATRSFADTIFSFKTDQLKINDDF
jgi:putative transposase